MNSCVLDDATIKKIMDVFEDQINLANTLDPEKRKKSNLLWECTYVRNLLTGKGEIILSSITINEHTHVSGVFIHVPKFETLSTVESFLHLEKFSIENNTTHYYYVLYLWENNQIYSNYDSIVLDGIRELL